MRVAAVLMAVLAAAQAGPETLRKRVLILGDSISIGYTPFVRESLRDVEVVVRPTLGGKDENCEGTAKGAKEVSRWLALEGGSWDVIHFNFGLHDLKRVDAKTGKNSDNPEDPRQSEPEAYEKNLREIVAALRKSGAKLVFAATTPVPAGRVKPCRDPEDPPRYNAIARKVMEESGVAVNDLHAFAQPKLREIQLPQNVHFTKEGSQLLAGEVVRHIRQALGLPAGK
jgi:acyl-CoA thioesterase-1